MPESRYAYYRRCHVFRRNGEQCKAPAQTGSHICYPHAGQLATAVRREQERGGVLAEAVAEMRRRGKPECEMADLFMDFKGINVTLAVMARALIAGRIDCKTAGRMVVHLQTCSKLLWLYHRAHRGTQREKALTTKDTKEHEGLPQISADKRRLKPENWAVKSCVRLAPDCGSAKILQFEVMAFRDRSWAHGPPESKAA